MCLCEVYTHVYGSIFLCSTKQGARLPYPKVKDG